MGAEVAFAHIWVQLFEGAAVGLAMYCIIQFYAQIRDHIAEHRPFLKLLSIKLVIFFCFWQNFLISFISTSFTPTKKINYPDVKVGIPSMLLTLEMAIFAVLHLWSFPWRKPYSLRNHNFDAVTAPGSGFSGTPHYQGGPLGIYAFADAGNPWDIIKASARGVRWLVKGRRYREEDASYKGVAAGAGASDDPFADPRQQSSPGRKANGVYGAADSTSDGRYSSAKLYPVGPGGPVSLHQGSADDIHAPAPDLDTGYHSPLVRPQRQTHVEEGDISGNTRMAYLAPEPAPSHLYADRSSSFDSPFGSRSASRGPSPSRHPDEDGDRTGLLGR
ncbi:MAG: hypothetical protein M1831_002155 [Alyxoria varia]|nr:MAG: hypothetical protein M1831_002155 [Alyxoria varia]